MVVPICTRCVLDEMSCNIIFDDNGVCNYCLQLDDFNSKTADLAFRSSQLDKIISEISLFGEKNTYDCLIGLSGGVDSSYLAYLAVKKFNLRPLAVHFDNGWNSSLSVENVNNLVSHLDLDLRTYVIDWDEFKDLQLAYLRSSVVDIEVPTDHIIMATMHKYAHENGIKYILNGCNRASESIMPSDWNFPKEDLQNLLDIQRQYGTIKLKRFPSFGLKKRLFYQHIVGIKQVYPLNYLNYKISDAKEILSKKLGWKDYGGKHYESVWTRFYQGYILPKKFKIDKRKAHYSSLILSGQMDRETALKLLKEEPYPVNIQNQDVEYITRKLGLSEESFEKIMKSEPISHLKFKTESPHVERWTKVFQIAEEFIFYFFKPLKALSFIKYNIGSIFKLT
jgi:N-acetyl sugar amidotransferase